MEGFGVRKGGWSQEEDMLLKKCIEKYGEGNWHRVPQRAGLNRCRKSCRLRWLNYLSPNIKRGAFSPDEIDLIIRLHKLLGNRWSLIAGRVPGRTANDVKNYWNTHQREKKKKPEICRTKETSQYHKLQPVKPKPRLLSANCALGMGTGSTASASQNHAKACATAPVQQPLGEDNDIVWWDGLLPGDGIIESSSAGSGGFQALPASHIFHNEHCMNAQGDVEINDLFVELDPLTGLW